MDEESIIVLGAARREVFALDGVTRTALDAVAKFFGHDVGSADADTYADMAIRRNGVRLSAGELADTELANGDVVTVWETDLGKGGAVAGA